MIKLELKIRERGDSLRLSQEQIRGWMDRPEEIAKQAMYAFFLPLKDDKPTVHDYVFIQQVIDWVPVDDRTGRTLGLPLKIQVRLINLTNQLIPFDDAKEPQPGFIELSTKDIDLLWSRMTDDKFLVGSVSPPYAAFLMDFQEATKKYFKVFEEEMKEKAERAEAKEEAMTERIKETVGEDGREEKAPA